MVVKNSLVSIIDNSGAFEAQCIQILKKGKSPKAELGDVLRVVITKTKVKSKIKKGELFLAQIVRLKSKKKGKTSFSENAAILIKDKNKTPVGNKLLGPIDLSVMIKSPLLALLARSQIR